MPLVLDVARRVARRVLVAHVVAVEHVFDERGVLLLVVDRIEHCVAARERIVVEQIIAVNDGVRKFKLLDYER